MGQWAGQSVSQISESADRTASTRRRAPLVARRKLLARQNLHNTTGLVTRVERAEVAQAQLRHAAMVTSPVVFWRFWRANSSGRAAQRCSSSSRCGGGAATHCWLPWGCTRASLQAAMAPVLQQLDAIQQQLISCWPHVAARVCARCKLVGMPASKKKHACLQGGEGWGVRQTLEWTVTCNVRHCLSTCWPGTGRSVGQRFFAPRKVKLRPKDTRTESLPKLPVRHCTCLAPNDP